MVLSKLLNTCIERFISKKEQRNIFDSFINAEFQGGRHTRRVDKIDC